MADDDELNDMLANLDAIDVGGKKSSSSQSSSSSSTKPVLPDHWNETMKKEEFGGRRHDDRDVDRLMSKLDQRFDMPKVEVPHTQEVKPSTAGPCAGCHALIYDATFETAGNLKFHDACFKCSRCTGRIHGQCERDGNKLLCSNCVKASLPRCHRCKNDIALTDKFVQTDDGKHYHSPGCITCAKCHTRLGDNVYVAKGDMWCRDCF